jgi:hypothetical protein
LGDAGGRDSVSALPMLSVRLAQHSRFEVFEMLPSAKLPRKLATGEAAALGLIIPGVFRLKESLSIILRSVKITAPNIQSHWMVAQEKS